MSRSFGRALLLAAALACGAALACAGALRPASRVDPHDGWTSLTDDAGAPPAAPVKCGLGLAGPDGVTTLERAVRDAVRNARFDEVIDLGPKDDPTCPLGPSCKTAPIAHRPSVDLAVIAFAPGCPPAFPNAMMARDFPDVRLARFDAESLAITGVRFRRWDQARWDAEGPAAPFTDADDIVPAPRGEAIDFTVPYPASSFKLLLAIAVLAEVDRGALRLADRFEHATKKREIREWLADMITWSDDESTQALVRKLHALGAMARLPALFARLGLATLQIHDTSAKTGKGWHPGRIHMTAWDTARLLWLLDLDLDPDAPPPSWRAPGGAPVDAGFLSAASKQHLLGLLAEQAFHDVLSTTALCGTPRTSRGIAALLPDRWIDPDGRVRLEVGSRTGDVRPCNAAADVTFAHKTGLTLNFGSDVGIVRGIPGRAQRRYLIAFFSNLGHRYTDADKASGPNPCRELGICYTARIGAMAREIDAAIAASIEARPDGGN